MNEKQLTDFQKHEAWLNDIEARLRFLEQLHCPAFSGFKEQELGLPLLSRTKPEGEKEHGAN